MRKINENLIYEILKFIKIYSIKNGYPPTLREIAKKFNISHTTASNYLKLLEKMKKLKFSKSKKKRAARGIIIK
ncbi:MAG: HTH domain-containing protein [bacterium]|nr:HTH domain-containing protein [bacterium]